VSEIAGILFCQSRLDSLFFFVSQWIENDFYRINVKFKKNRKLCLYISIFTRSFTESTPETRGLK